MKHTREKVIKETYHTCDFCNIELDERSDSWRCSHCGKDVCSKHYKKCLNGIGEDTWFLCPECSPKVELKDSEDEPDELNDFEVYQYPIWKDTKEPVSLPHW